MTNETQGEAVAAQGGAATSIPELMSVEEFAALTRRTKSAVVAAILRGDVPANKLGSRRWWIRRSDIMAMFETNARKR